MKTLSIAIGMSLAALLAPAAFGQADKPGESRAAPSTPHTKEQKRDARAQRQDPALQRAPGLRVGMRAIAAADRHQRAQPRAMPRGELQPYHRASLIGRSFRK